MRTSIIVAGFLLLSPSLASAQAMKCDIDLFKAKQSETTFEVTDLFELELVSDSNYSEAKRASSGKYAYYFEGGFSTFDQRRAEKKREAQYRYQHSQARNFVSSTVDDGALAAYKACLKSDSPLTATLSKSPGERLLVVRVLFGPRTAVPRPNPLRIQFVGARPFGAAPDAPGAKTSATIVDEDFNGGEKAFLFERSGEAEFVAVIQMPALGLVANDIALPATPKIKTVVEERGMTVQGGPQSIRQPFGAPVGLGWSSAPCIKPTPGWAFVKGSAKAATITGDRPTCVKVEPKSETESSICYSVVMSINAGENCTARWILQATERRTARVFE